MSYVFGKFGASNIGNTSGVTGTVNRGIVFAGGNNVTLSQSINGSSATLSISAANQTVQTQNLHNLTLSGNTAGVLAHVSSGTLTLAGGNNITLSQNGNAITISGGAGGGGGGIALANSQTTYTSGTVSLLEAGGAITIASTTGQRLNFSVPVVSSLSATGALSISNNGATVSIGAPAFSAGISNIGNTAGTSGTASNQVIFAGGNNVTLSQSTAAGGRTISISGANQSNQNISLYALGNTTQNSSTVLNASNMSFNGLGAATMGYSNGSIQVSAPATSSLSATGALSISTNGGTISIGAPAFSAGISNIGNTAGTSGTASNRVVFAGGNNITLSQSTAAGGHTITISAGAGGGGGGIALANSQTTYTSGTAHMSVVGGALTIASTTGQSFNFSAPAQSNLSATGIVSISNNGNTISIGASIPKRSMSFYQNMDRGTNGTLAVPFASMMLQRLNQENDLLPGNITANTLLINMTANMTATSLSTAHTISASIGIYTDNATNLGLINSASTTWALGASTGNTSNYHGPRWLSFVSSQWSSAPVFEEGGEYVFGIIFRSSSYAPPLSYYGQNYLISNQRSGFIGTSFATNTSLAQGNYWNAVMNTAALPTGITSSQVNRNNASAIFIPHIILNNRYSGTF